MLPDQLHLVRCAPDFAAAYTLNVRVSVVKLVPDLTPGNAGTLPASVAHWAARPPSAMTSALTGSPFRCNSGLGRAAWQILLGKGRWRDRLPENLPAGGLSDARSIACNGSDVRGLVAAGDYNQLV